MIGSWSRAVGCLITYFLRGFGNAMSLFKIPRFCRRGRFDYQIGNSSRGCNVTIDVTARFQRRSALDADIVWLYGGFAVSVKMANLLG